MLSDVVKLTGYESDNVRIRRAVGDKYIEMLIVADKTMHTEYGNKLQDYLLTVVNVVSNLRMHLIYSQTSGGLIFHF